VAGSLVIGVVAATFLAFAPFIPATESGVTGAVLVGLAVGWAMLAVLSMRSTDQPQKWALVPALFMGSGGLLLVVFGSPMRGILAWVWPPALLVLAAWMILKVRRQLRSRGGRLLLYPVIAVLVLASLGGGHETVRARMHEEARPEQGRLIDVGGHRLHLECTGSGSPTVVLEPGAGNMSSDLALITPVIARETRVCVYDRAGRGWSDPASSPQDAARITADLHTLLQRANEPGPYVLAGHSFGGLYALTFADRYPQDVAGLVLVDSTAPASTSTPGTATGSATSNGPGPSNTRDRASALVTGAARLGIGRVLGAPTPDHLWSTVHEFMQGEASMQQAAALETFADKPLVVLTAGSGSRPGWGSLQESLAALSTNTAHRVVDGSTHASLIGDPKDAAATTRGILDVVSAVRTASPLPP
jgi:pimeloyl-ACP methyl ester carboxylesterase